MQKSGVCVFGSLNYDFVVLCPRFPLPGETVKGSGFMMQAGGKGANQAFQSARLGADTYMIGCVGNDFMGDELIAGLSSEDADIRYVVRHNTLKTGVALISVDKTGNNAITVSPNANGECTKQMLNLAQKAFDESSIFMTQLETNIEAITYALQKARNAGCKIILDPAPAMYLPGEIWKMTDIVKPNETEAAFYTGLPVDEENLTKWAKQASAKLKEMGAPSVIITLGENGCWYSGEEEFYVPAFKINAVDTTASGDSFAGALAVALSEEKTMKEAIIFASAAGAITASRPGAQRSIGKREEVDLFLKERAEEVNKIYNFQQ